MVVATINGMHPAMAADAAIARRDTYLFVDGNYLTCCCDVVARIVLGEPAALPSVRALKQRFNAGKVFYCIFRSSWAVGPDTWAVSPGHVGKNGSGATA